MSLSWLMICTELQAQKESRFGKNLRLFASFDQSEHAEVARGDRHLYTAKSLQRKVISKGLPKEHVRVVPAGRFGGCLQIDQKIPQILFFRGKDNVGYQTGSFSGTVSFWLSTDPTKELPAGYVDPLQITDKKWNNASIFVDFTKETPRQFRLGIFSEYKFWNPQDVPWDKLPDTKKPLVGVTPLPFQGKKWTHVALTYQGFNEAKSSAKFYLDGKLAGALDQPQKYVWNTEKLAIMIGIAYAGRMDDFAILDRALSPKEIAVIYSSNKSIVQIK